MELNRAKNEMDILKRKIKKLEDTKNTVRKRIYNNRINFFMQSYNCISWILHESQHFGPMMFESLVCKSEFF